MRACAGARAQMRKMMKKRCISKRKDERGSRRVCGKVDKVWVMSVMEVMEVMGVVKGDSDGDID